MKDIKLLVPDEKNLHVKVLQTGNIFRFYEGEKLIETNNLEKYGLNFSKRKIVEFLDDYR